MTEISHMRLNHIDINLNINRSSARQILQELEFYLTLSQIVADLLQSMKNVKQNNTFFAEEVEYKIQSFQVTRNSNLLIERTLINDSFQADLQTLKNMKIFLESKAKKIFSHIMEMLRGQMHSWVGNFKDNMTKRIQRNCSYRRQSSDPKTFVLRKQNMLNYLRCIYSYLVQKHNQANLYNRLKEITDRWIGQTHTQLIQRRLHLLYKKSQTKKQLKQALKLIDHKTDEVHQSQKDEPKQKDNKNYFKLTYSQLQGYISHLRNKIYSYPLVNAVCLPQEQLDWLCCLRFIYDFSLLQSNEFKTSRNLDNLIILEKYVQFEMYENPVKEAASALLNSYGGYILIGLQKSGINYKYEKGQQLSISMMKYRKEALAQWAAQTINRRLLSKEKNQIFDHLIKVDCIPVFNTGMQEKNPAISKVGQYIFRIRIMFDRNIMMVGHYISDKFYDIVKQQQAYVQLKQNRNKDLTVGMNEKNLDVTTSIDKNIWNDTNRNSLNNTGQDSAKDKIYKKLRSLTNDYGCFTFEQTKGKGIDYLSRLNQRNKGLHQGQCRQPHDGYPTKQTISQLTQSEANKAVEKQKVHVEAKAKEQYQNQDKEDFKHVNLIVLESNTIKQSCEAYFRQKKIAFKIQKLKTTLKKLAKQTYVIHHNKKYEEINTYLSQFKRQKQYNVNKKIILISAQKGVCIQDKLNLKDLEQVKRMLNQEHKGLDKQIVYYVEDPKERRSYFRTDTKITGIYLYFILSEMNIKSKMKNVPVHMLNSVQDITKAILRKKENESKKIEPKRKYQNTNNYYDNTYENNGNQYNPNQYNGDPYNVNQYNQNQYDMNQQYGNQYNENYYYENNVNEPQQYTEEKVRICYQWKVFFANTFYQYFAPQYPSNINLAISQFTYFVNSNLNYKDPFQKCMEFYLDEFFYITK